MTASVPTVETLIVGFPNTTLPTIDGLPTYEILKELRTLLKENATSILCTLGGGNHGYLGMVVAAAIYSTIVPAQAFTIPAQPPTLPLIAPGATAALTAETVRRHTEQLRIWHEYTNMHNALKKQLQHAVPSLYLRALRHAHSGFMNISLREILAHLFTAYGRITPHDLSNNNKQFQEPWDPSTPFETCIEKIKTAIEYAADGNAPYTDGQIVNNVYNLVAQTRMYFEDCKAWDRRPADEHTWDNFKTHFLLAQQILRNQQATSQQGGYHANLATWTDTQVEYHTETATALANLATANAADREVFCALVTNNSKLTEQLATALSEITRLTHALSNNHGISHTRTPNTSRMTSGHPSLPKSYCWTHGYKVSKNHTSTNCERRAPGHQTATTAENLLGGNTEGQPIPA
jgi:hypothetical protein